MSPTSEDTRSFQSATRVSARSLAKLIADPVRGPYSKLFEPPRPSRGERWRFVDGRPAARYDDKNLLSVAA